LKHPQPLSRLPSMRLDQVPNPYKSLHLYPVRIVLPMFRHRQHVFTSRTTWHSYTLPSANLVDFHGSSDRADFYPALFLAQPPIPSPFP
jgi:hypothetical protein